MGPLFLTFLPWKAFSLRICLLPHREHAACPLPRACPWVPPAFLHAALESPAGRMAHPLEVLGHFSNTALHFNSIHLASKFCILVSGTILETPWRSQEVPVPWREDTAKPGVSHCFVFDSLKWTMIISKIAAKIYMKRINMIKTKAADYICLEIGVMLSLRRGGGSTRSIEIFFKLKTWCSRWT